MSSQRSDLAGDDEPAETTPHGLPPNAQRVVQELIDEHRLASCLLLPIDDTTWAIQGSIPYEGEVILAEFDDRGDALVALEQIAAAGIPVSMR